MQPQRKGRTGCAGVGGRVGLSGCKLGRMVGDDGWMAWVRLRDGVGDGVYGSLDTPVGVGQDSLGMVTL